MYGWRTVTFKRFFSTDVGVGGGEGGWFRTHWPVTDEDDGLEVEKADASGSSDGAEQWARTSPVPRKVSTRVSCVVAIQQALLAICPLS